MSLSDRQRRRIHDFALDARALLTNEAHGLLEGVYGLHVDGRLDAPERLPQVQSDAETAETYRRLKQYLVDEERAGLSRREAVDKLVKEIAFTHLNRLVAFKMMEARKLIRGTVNKGVESNAFKFYLADPEHADDLALHQRGAVDDAYRHFLLWQSGQVAQEVRVLFDPDTLSSRLFPRPRALYDLLDMLNDPDLADVWGADETIGWVYQYFNEPELQAAFAKVSRGGEKFEAKDIPSATQLFTPHWIVRYLVQNTLGRMWVAMHPDTRLLGSELLDYLVPLQDAHPRQPLKAVREITLLDPACGGMHFGLVAFDLFAAMYEEELARAGEPGWPEEASVAGPEEIPAAIIAHNLYGIDIDLRAVQLSALALYLKAKSLNPKARISESNLVSADIQLLNGARLGTFLREMKFSRPIYERLIRALWERLQDVDQLGSLLRLEKEMRELIAAERAKYGQEPLFAFLPDSEFEEEAAEEAYWHILGTQIVQALDEFARQQAAAGVDQRFFTGEAVKGVRLLDLMLRDYDVVVTNPPYSGKKNLNKVIADYLESAYPRAKNDLYTAFIQRGYEFLKEDGRLGMITQQSFMFISNYKKLRADLRATCAIETMAHLGPRAFAEISGEKVNTTAFVLRVEADAERRENQEGVYFRLVHAPDGDAKRRAFERALADGSNTYRVAQRRFDAIPGSPWVYWVRERIRLLFEELPGLREVAQPRVGTQTADNARFLRFWWEVGFNRLGLNCASWGESRLSGSTWFPYMKGGPSRKWYGNQEYVVNWRRNAQEIEACRPASVIRNPDFYFREGVTWTDLGAAGFSARINPGGFVFDVSGSCAFPNTTNEIPGVLAIMNSMVAGYLLALLNPTLHYQVGDLARLPVPNLQINNIQPLVENCVRLMKKGSNEDEPTFDFVVPPRWQIDLEHLIASQARLAELERKVDVEIYHLYGISDEDREIIEAELAGELIGEDEEKEGNEAEAPMTEEELAVRWISYAVGIVLGRFRPGIAGELGSAVYRKSDFAIGSLPEPSDDEFDQLVGTPDRFAYIDEEGGRHVFSAQVERALRELAMPDGITVLDAGHPRDLPALVEKALRLMLDGEGAGDKEQGGSAADEVIATGAKGDLRKFLNKDFFTEWHVKWYRKRPVYWWLQSAKRGYGFVLFHEKVEKYTLYVLLREYADHKINGLSLRIQDLQAGIPGKSGRALRQLEKEIEQTRKLLEEVREFAKTMERIANDGYQPEENWIDDGVILRLAPLWELIPIWKAEPKKYWQRLAAGDYDWSHIAMRYWPERVREACRTNKSFAIAHGHEEWYEGD